MCYEMTFFVYFDKHRLRNTPFGLTADLDSHAAAAFAQPEDWTTKERISSANFAALRFYRWHLMPGGEGGTLLVPVLCANEGQLLLNSSF